MLERFEARDRRFVLVCLAVGLVCGAVALRYFGRAFPEASIHFTVNRTESTAVADGFLVSVGESDAGFKHAATFDFDDETKTFLERRLGLERAQEIYGKQVRLWRWSHRWFKPHEKEELRVDVTAGGEVAHFEHLLPEEAPGAALEPDSARVLAERFLTSRMHQRLDDFDFVEGSSTQQPHRVDHTFTWKKKDFDVGDPDATYRMSLTVAGDRVTGYDEFLDIPQAWQDDYAKLRARNDTAAIVAFLFLLLTWLAMAGSLVLRIRDRDVRWRTVLGFGAVAFALQLLSALNQFDLEKFGYETQDSYASFVTSFVLQSVLGALAFGGFIVLLTAAAEPIYRERYPDKLALPALFTARGLRTKRFFKEVLLGLTLMLFFAAYQSVFYVVAAHYGAWAPLEVPYSNLLNTAIPWALVLFIGFFPAVSEEFTSRMFSVPFLQKHLPRIGLRGRLATVAAVVLASYIWGFAHSNYPNQPFWIRGFEVGTAGIVVSLVMLRWGILATLVWHYTVDAFYTAMLMLRSGNPYFVVSGSVTAGIMLVPLVLSLLSYWRRGGFEPEADLLNRATPGPQPAFEPPVPEAPPARAVSAPVPRRRIVIGAAVAVVLLLLYVVPVEEPGEGIEVETQRSEALGAARVQLQRLGSDPQHWQTAIQLASRYEPDAGRYILEHASLTRLNEIYASHMRTPVWRVRFYRPDQREEWVLNLPVGAPAGAASGAPAGADSGAPAGADSSGPVGAAAGASTAARGTAPAVLPLWAFEHVVPDSAAGDTLGIDAAQLLASDFLREQGIEPADLDLKESRSERQKARTDHTFEWQVPDSTLGEAGVRYMVVVRGGEVGGLRPYIHLPEAWLRAYNERSVLQQILWVLSRGVLGVVFLGIVMLFVLEVRAHRFPWVTSLRWGGAAALLSVVLVGLRWRSDIVMRYETTMPFRLFLVGAGVSIVVQVLMVGLVVAVLVGTLFAIRPQSRALFAGGLDRRRVRDALLLALVGVVLQIGVRRLGIVLTDFAARYASFDELLLLPAAARPLPWLDVWLDQLRNTLLMLPALALLVHLMGHRFGARRAVGFLALAVLLFAAEGARSPAEFGLQLAIGGASAALLVFVFGYLFRDNDLAYVLAFLAGRGLGSAVSWLQQPEPAIRVTGAIVAGLLVATLALVVWAAARPRAAGWIAAPPGGIASP